MIFWCLLPLYKMIIKSFQLDKINFKTFDIFLLYGKNEGFKNEVINKYFVNKLDGELTKYDEQEFIENSEIIVSELLNKSLFDNQKILIISRVSDKIIKIIQDLLQRDLLDTKIILKANSLEKKSKIRNFF